MLLRRLRSAVLEHKKSDQGSTLVPVIVLTSVGLLVVAILGNIIISSLDSTSRSRATIQAEVAAEAGLALGAKEISNCQAGGARFNVNQTNPRVDVQIRYFPKGSTELNMASGIAACPPKGAFIFKVVSTGFSLVSSGALSASPFSIRMEEVFDYAVSGPYESGPAGIFGGRNVSLGIPPTLSGGSGNAPLIFTDGFNCPPPSYQGVFEIPNDVWVLTGRLEVNVGCNITGQIYAQNSTPCINKGTAGCIPVNVITASTVLPKGVIRNWVRLQSDPNIWTDAGFERIITISSRTASPGTPNYFFNNGICGNNLSQLNQILSPDFPAGYLVSETEPIPDTVVDSFGKCGPGGISGALDLNLQADVVILADKFVLDELNIQSKDGRTHRVWLVVPMTPSDPANPCLSGSGATEKILIRDFDIDTTKIKISIYTTGYLELGSPGSTGDLFRGQLFACDFRSGLQDAEFIYDPSGLPGYNLDTGAVIVDGNYPRSALLKFKRDVSQ